jgi:hypothetical protein
VQEITGGAGVCRLDLAAMRALGDHPDPAVAMAGQVGSQIKVRAGGVWLLANVRDLRLHDAGVIANVDFLGEGRDAGGGTLAAFRRGVTRYPVPGDEAYPVTRSDLAQIFEAAGRPHIEIGTVYPTSDVRASLLFDTLLGKHFALLGSTGTGKSTSTALILHRIIEKAPHGHIVMLDPHGEYAAAFASTGSIYDVDNLAAALLADELRGALRGLRHHRRRRSRGRHGHPRQDACCRRARRTESRSRSASSRSTAPVPYLLSDLLAALSTMMGKLDKADGPRPTCA